MKKAISPVIATVIIVAVTIAIAIAVALWMSGLVGSFTATENLQIISAYAEGSKSSGWTITLEVKNVGTTDATIDNIFINGKPLSSSSYSNIITPKYAIGDENPVDFEAGKGFTLQAGKTATITIQISKDSDFTSGQMIEVKLHTASGKEYPKQVTLP